MDPKFGELFEEHVKRIAREAVQELITEQGAYLTARSDASLQFREQLNRIKSKEYVTVKEAALLLSCSESHIRKLVMLTRKGKAHRPIPFVDMEGVTVFCLITLLEWANSSRQLQVVKNEAA